MPLIAMGGAQNAVRETHGQSHDDPDRPSRRDSQLVSNFLGEKFSSLDANNDGTLDPSEAIAAIVKGLGMSEIQARRVFDSLDLNKDGRISRSEARKSTVFSFIVFNFLVAPSMVFIVCMILGFVLALAEGWEPLQGFYFVACNVTGAGPFWSPKDNTDLSVFGEVMEIIISIVSTTLSGAIIGLAALMSLASVLPEKLDIVHNARRGMLTIFLVIPIAVIVFCFIVGSLLAVVEGWPVRAGFEFLITTVCGLNNSLTSYSPETDVMKIVALMVATSALGITSVIIGVVGAMTLCEDTVAYIEVQIYRVETALGCRGLWCLPEKRAKKLKVGSVAPAPSEADPEAGESLAEAFELSSSNLPRESAEESAKETSAESSVEEDLLRPSDPDPLFSAEPAQRASFLEGPLP